MMWYPQIDTKRVCVSLFRCTTSTSTTLLCLYINFRFHADDNLYWLIPDCIGNPDTAYKCYCREQFSMVYLMNPVNTAHAIISVLDHYEFLWKSSQHSMITLTENKHNMILLYVFFFIIHLELCWQIIDNSSILCLSAENSDHWMSRWLTQNCIMV